MCIMNTNNVRRNNNYFHLVFIQILLKLELYKYAVMILAYFTPALVTLFRHSLVILKICANNTRFANQFIFIRHHFEECQYAQTDIG